MKSDLYYVHFETPSTHLTGERDDRVFKLVG